MFDRIYSDEDDENPGQQIEIRIWCEEFGYETIKVSSKESISSIKQDIIIHFFKLNDKIKFRGDRWYYTQNEYRNHYIEMSNSKRRMIDDYFDKTYVSDWIKENDVFKLIKYTWFQKQVNIIYNLFNIPLTNFCCKGRNQSPYKKNVKL